MHIETATAVMPMAACPKPNAGITGSTSGVTDWFSGAAFGAILDWWLPLLIACALMALVMVFSPKGAVWLKKGAMVIGIVLGTIFVIGIAGTAIDQFVKNC